MTTNKQNYYGTENILFKSSVVGVVPKSEDKVIGTRLLWQDWRLVLVPLAETNISLIRFVLYRIVSKHGLCFV